MKKSLSITVLIGIIIFAILFSTGKVVAFSSSDATIHASFSNPTPHPGDLVLVSVTFQSNVAQQLKIYAIGVHADWMEATQLYGPNLSSDPATVAANGVYATQFSLPIPADVSIGAHVFTVGVDGLDASGNAFSVDSPQSTLELVRISSSDATVQVSLSDYSPVAGDTILVTVTFQSNIAQQLRIYAIGLHADWMAPTQFYGPNLQSDPAIVAAKGVYVTQFSLPIPTDTSVGTHTFCVGVDGLDTGGNAFSFESTQSSMEVAGATFDDITVSLENPDNNTAKTDNFNAIFSFMPILRGTDSFQRASLILNGTIVATNQTAVSNNTINSISYTFIANGTYYWNIRLENHTDAVTALAGARNITIALYVPDPTPSPTPTPTQTSSASTTTPRPTPSNQPTTSPSVNPTPIVPEVTPVALLSLLIAATASLVCIGRNCKSRT